MWVTQMLQPKRVDTATLTASSESLSTHAAIRSYSSSLHYEEHMQLRIAQTALDLEFRLRLLKAKTKYRVHRKTTACLELH